MPPHSVEAEQAVLGGLLLDNAAWDRIADLLAPEDFYRDDHRRIYRHIGRLIDATRPADVVTVTESIDSSEDKDKTGGLAYLGMLAQSTPSAHNIRRYAEIVRERAVMRRLISVANDISDSAFNPHGKEMGQLLDEAESRIFEIAEAGARGRQGFVEIQPLLAQVMERIDTLYHRENASDITGVPTGYHDLDQMTSGLQEGDLVIIAGRPSMGKAQPLDAKVLTTAGWKRMGDLRFGDYLASTDRKVSQVSGVFPQGVRQAWRVTLSDGRSTECCDEHLWRVGFPGWDGARVLTTAQLRGTIQAPAYKSRLQIATFDGQSGGGETLPPTVEAIVPTRMAEMQCISVSHPSRLYVTDDCIVTHNTAFALNIAEHVAVENRLPVAVFSMEMSGTQLATRMLGSIGRLDQHKLRTARLSDEDWGRLTHAVSRLHDAPIHIDETAALNSLELKARARRLHRQYGKLGLVVIDYLQLMSAIREGENRATEISEVSRSLKALAKELKVPVVALSQLNRGLEQRPNKRPVMSDLRESGAIEQDADVILFIYRDEVYNPESADKGKAEIIIGKQRNGPIGMVPLTFLGQYTRFENFATGHF